MCAVNVMHSNHPKAIPQLWSVEKLSSMKPVPSTKKVGDRCSTQTLEIHPINMYFVKLSVRCCVRFWNYKYKEAMLLSFQEFLH